MIVVVHTVIMTVADIEVCARFYHAMYPTPQRLTLALVGKQMAVTFKKNIIKCGKFKRRVHQPRLHHNFRAFSVGGVRTTGSAANPAVSSTKDEPLPELPASAVPTQPLIIERTSNNDNVVSGVQALDAPLTCNATAQQTTTWLQLHRFSAYIRTLSSFSGADLLRMSRDDLIQICGLADGIRMFNALHAKAKTVYLCVQTSPVVYHAVYLASLSSQEMKSKLASLVGVSVTQIHDIYMQGPGGIHVIISDELVRNIKDEAIFTVEVLQDHPADHCCLLLKPPVSVKIDGIC